MRVVSMTQPSHVQSSEECSEWGKRSGPPITLKMEMSSPGSQVKFWSIRIIFVAFRLPRKRQGKCRVRSVLRMMQDAIPPSSFKMDMSPPGSQVKVWTSCISLVTVRGEGPSKCCVRSVLRMAQDAIPPSRFKMDMSPPGSQVKVWTTFITFLTSHVREEWRGECHGNGQGQPQANAAGTAGTAQRHDSLTHCEGLLAD